MVFALETYCPATDGRSAARIEEEVVVTPTGPEVITRFPADELLVAGTHLRARRRLRATADGLARRALDGRRREPAGSNVRSDALLLHGAARPHGHDLMAADRSDSGRSTECRSARAGRRPRNRRSGFDVDLYRRMLLIRGVEDRVQSALPARRGVRHDASLLRPGGRRGRLRERAADGDRVACTYRGHGHLLALGTDPEALLAELLGRSTGVNGGRAGSMNIVDPDHGVLGCYGIVGGSIAAATGAALSLRGSGSIAVAYFGDGATNQAYFFECLNFAKVLDLPVVFVCENNGYGEYTPMEAVTAGGDLSRAPRRWACRRARSTAWTSGRCSEAALEVTERVRGGGGPEFVEASTYRFVGHSRSDPGKYRPDGRARTLAGARPARRRRAAAARPSTASSRRLAAIADVVDRSSSGSSRRRSRRRSRTPGRSRVQAGCT